MQLNKDNFLIWNGDFKPAPYNVKVANQTLSIVRNAASIVIDPFLGSDITFGINYLSFQIISQPDGEAPVLFNTSTNKIIYNIPAGSAVGNKKISFNLRDKAGNLSNTATITINLLERPTSWRGYGQQQCVKDTDGQNTGYAYYTTIEKYFTDDQTSFSDPATTKANNSSDPDYIMPNPNSSLCPLPGQNAEMDFISTYQGSQINSVNFLDASTGAFVAGYTINSNSNTGTVAVMVPIGVFNLQINYTFPKNTNTNPPVDNTGNQQSVSSTPGGDVTGSLNFQGVNAQSAAVSNGNRTLTLNNCSIDASGYNSLTLSSNQLS